MPRLRHSGFVGFRFHHSCGTAGGFSPLSASSFHVLYFLLLASCFLLSHLSPPSATLYLFVLYVVLNLFQNLCIYRCRIKFGMTVKGYAIFNNAFTIATATVLPPFLPNDVINGYFICNSTSFDSTALTNPTGTPITSSGLKPSFLISFITL